MQMENYRPARLLDCSVLGARCSMSTSNAINIKSHSHQNESNFRRLFSIRLICLEDNQVYLHRGMTWILKWVQMPAAGALHYEWPLYLDHTHGGSRDFILHNCVFALYGEDIHTDDRQTPNSESSVRHRQTRSG